MFLTFIQQYPFILAFILGLVPALIWLWFWLKEDRHPEPAKMVTLAFLGGILSVVAVLPIEKFILDTTSDHEFLSFVLSGSGQENLRVALWAATEEILKFSFVWYIALRFKKIANEPVDDIIYLIISALGFATFENTLFLIDPIQSGNIWGTIVNSNLRFIGASLLHIMSSATIGICMAISFYKTSFERRIYTISGLLIAIVLHTAFNLFILNGIDNNIFVIFGMVWICIVILLLIFERVKHMRKMHTLPISHN